MEVKIQVECCFSIIVRESNAYFWSNLESGSKVFFSMFSCYIGIVLHETA